MLPQGFRLETIDVKGLKGRGVRGLLDAVYGIPAGLLQSSGIVKVSTRLHSASAAMHPDRCCWLRSCGASAALSWNKTFNRALPIRCWHALSIRFLLHTARLPPTCQAKRCWRQEIQCVGRGCRMRKDEKFTLLIFGGSAGAHRINMAVLDALEQMTDLASQLRIVHQTGAADFSAISKAYQALPFDAEALPFIDRMDDAYARAISCCAEPALQQWRAHGVRQSGDSPPTHTRFMITNAGMLKLWLTGSCRGDSRSGIEWRRTGVASAGLSSGSEKSKRWQERRSPWAGRKPRRALSMSVTHWRRFESDQRFMLHKKHRVHFVGIGGIGMSGIAEVLLNSGYVVSGSDLHDSEAIRRLRNLGAQIFVGIRKKT